MSQESMERALGKLVIDAAFRDAFLQDPMTTSARAGRELTDRERSALSQIPPGALAAFHRYLEGRWTRCCRSLMSRGEGAGLVHVLPSLIGIGSGLIVMFGRLTGKQLDRWNTLFLATTVATSVTGFGFPFDHLLPSHKVGIISLVVLVVAILARHALHPIGVWRRIYVLCAAVALYLNVFVGVVPAFPSCWRSSSRSPLRRRGGLTARPRGAEGDAISPSWSLFRPCGPARPRPRA